MNIIPQNSSVEAKIQLDQPNKKIEDKDTTSNSSEQRTTSIAQQCLIIPSTGRDSLPEDLVSKENPPPLPKDPPIGNPFPGAFCTDLEELWVCLDLSGQPPKKP